MPHPLEDPRALLRRLGYTVRFRDEQLSRLHWAVNAKLVDGQGRAVGEIDLVEDPKNGLFHITTAHTLDDIPKGQGIGSAFYQQTNAHIKQRFPGKHMASDLIRSDDANRVWQGLKAQGLATGPIRTPNGGARNNDYYVMEAAILLLRLDTVMGLGDVLGLV